MTTSHLHCEHCGTGMDDIAIRANTIEHPHDGLWCLCCLSLYYGQHDTYDLLVHRGGQCAQTMNWHGIATSREHAERIARTQCAQDVNSWVGEWTVLVTEERVAA